MGGELERLFLSFLIYHPVVFTAHLNLGEYFSYYALFQRPSPGTWKPRVVGGVGKHSTTDLVPMVHVVCRFHVGLQPPRGVSWLRVAPANERSASRSAHRCPGGAWPELQAATGRDGWVHIENHAPNTKTRGTAFFGPPGLLGINEDGFFSQFAQVAGHQGLKGRVPFVCVLLLFPCPSCKQGDDSTELTGSQSKQLGSEWVQTLVPLIQCLSLIHI